jgi:hypothetical protein
MGQFDTEREGTWMPALDERSVTETVYLMKFQRDAIFVSRFMQNTVIF